MYSFLYYFLYNVAIKRNPDAKFAASTGILVTFTGHFLLISGILKLFIKLPTFQFSEHYLYNKLAWMPFALIILVFIHISFSRNFYRIAKKYKNINILSKRNIGFAIALIILPFVIGIILLL